MLHTTLGLGKCVLGLY